MVEWVFVSPHLDDVVLSCGGAVAKAARTSSPRIVTVFAGIPEGELSEFAHFQHERWNLPEAEAVQRRRLEDERACSMLGSSVRHQWLDYPDAIYRDPDYSSDDALFGTPLKCDMTLAEQVHEHLRNLGSSRFVIPLGVGNHVDHQIVCEAGQLLLRGGADVWAYAEVPYALDETKLALALAGTNANEALSLSLDADALERKCAAVRAYESQLPVLFRDRGDPCEEVEAFARRQGGGDPVELLWKLRPDDDPMLRKRPFVA